MKSRKRVALVTGGCTEIGTAICRSLAGAGMKVVVADLDPARCEGVAAEVSGHAVQLDVADPDAVTGAVREVFEKAGRIDVCVNAAGWGKTGPFLDTDEVYAAKALEINLGGPVRVIRAVLPGMLENRWGRIVNVASDSPEFATGVVEPVFSAASAGVISLTENIAKEFAGNGVTSNAVRLLEREAGSPEAPAVSDTDARLASADETLQNRRSAFAAEVAPAVAFLASDEAASITGQTLSVGRDTTAG